jgi:hypothetical protein
MLVALLLAIGAAVYLWHWKDSARRAQLEANWVAAGLPLTIEEAIPPEIPASENAAWIYLRVFGPRNRDAYPSYRASLMSGTLGLLPLEMQIAPDDYARTPDATTEAAFRAALEEPAMQWIYEELLEASHLEKARFPVA